MTGLAKTQFTFFWNSEYAVLTTLKVGTRYLLQNREVLPKATNFTVTTSGSGLLVTLKEGCNLDHQIDFYQRKCGGSFLDFTSKFKKLYVLIRNPYRRAMSGLVQAINHHIKKQEDLLQFTNQYELLNSMATNSPEKYLELAEQKMREHALQILNNEHLNPYHFYVDRFLQVCPTNFEVIDLVNFNRFPQTEKKSNSFYIELLSDSITFQNLLSTKSFLIDIEKIYYERIKKQYVNYITLPT